MPVAVLMEFAGVTADQSDAVVADMDLGGELAAHGVFHVAGPIPGGGWRIVDVWDSEEAFEAYANTQIMPLAQKHGLTEPPQVSIWPVHNMLR